jgi:6,7-dimethyl-8-ribityllumazine synthase
MPHPLYRSNRIEYKYFIATFWSATWWFWRVFVGKGYFGTPANKYRDPTQLTMSSTNNNVKGLVTHSQVKSDGHVVIIKTRWNEAVIYALVTGAVNKITECGGTSEIIEVPGSYEVVYAAKRMIESKQRRGDKLDAVICIGCLIKGETMHFEYICEAVTQGIMKLNVEGDVPVIFGVLACMTEDQALARAGLIEGHHNHGPEWGQSALEMANIRKLTM